MIENDYYIFNFEILIKQERKKAENKNKREPKPSKAPPKGETKK
ncbi:hypothetical protein HPOKI102_00695 [Helicobacter pylori oki102]|nr:hypothetical protein HPOKI102_00695 [Helicobacter pylori oki102]AHN41266.1 hypothetical protein HPOKI422_00700 [Helicobacter pylori oki422]